MFPGREGFPRKSRTGMAFFLLIGRVMKLRAVVRRKYAMFSTLRRWGWMAALVVLALPASDSTTQVRVAGAAELGHGTRAVLWRDPSDIGSRNLLYGTGGQAHEPR